MILFAVDTKKTNIESFQYLVQFAFKCFFLTLSSFDVSADILCKNLDTDQDRQNIKLFYTDGIPKLLFFKLILKKDEKMTKT